MRSRRNVLVYFALPIVLDVVRFCLPSHQACTHTHTHTHTYTYIHTHTHTHTHKYRHTLIKNEFLPSPQIRRTSSRRILFTSTMDLCQRRACVKDGLVSKTGRYEHNIPVTNKALRWLPVGCRRDFRINILTDKPLDEEQTTPYIICNLRVTV